MSKAVARSLCLICCLGFPAIHGQQRTPDSELTRLLVTAIDRSGRIGRLTLPDISLQEGGKPVSIVDFKIQINAPTFLAIMIDASSSQKRILPLSKSTARVFVKGFVKPGRDYASIVSFADSVLVRQAATDDVAVLRSSIDTIQPVTRFLVDVSNGQVPDPKKPPGSTALADAVIFACDKVLNERNDAVRKAILLFTDGYDTGSTSKMKEAIEQAGKKDIAVYVVALPTKEEGALSLREDQPKLRKLAEQTGGRAYFPAKNEELESILAQVELNLRVQYIVSFRSGSTIERNKDNRLQIDIASPQKKKDGIQLAYRRMY